MDRLDAMHMFVRVVETSSFTKVAHEFADRKSTRLNSSHLVISYAVFCLKKKNIDTSSCHSCPAWIANSKLRQTMEECISRLRANTTNSRSPCQIYFSLAVVPRSRTLAS